MDEDKTLRIKVDGKVYAVDPGDVSRSLALECIQEIGMSHEQICAMIYMAPGKVAVHAFIWLSRRLAGEPRVRREGRTSKLLSAEIWDQFDDVEEVDLAPPPEEDATPPA